MTLDPFGFVMAGLFIIYAWAMTWLALHKD
jgi:hypothetical protein